MQAKQIITEDGAQPQTPDSEEVSGEVDAQIAELERELAMLKEDRLRERAEIENQRRRVAREAEQVRRFANERLLGDLLPVIDSLERALESDGEDAHVRQGVELTLKQLLKVAADHGLASIDPAGQPFDPERHQAMSTIESDAPAGTVVQVYQKGWLLNDRLLRPALVVVAK
ncbi:MAG TPA: nucleotide exchange factor GrpE [Xanthomonadaceae bacterium]|nr:nucleotide exchange factor GrpE [Xanthomonadaceae bacterium]